MKVLLSTFHSKYIHASLALPYLAAASSDIKGVEIIIREFTVRESIDSVNASFRSVNPGVAAFSCYIWNIEKTLAFLQDFKKANPWVFIVLGGPEVSYGAAEILKENPAVDCIVRGEGEASFRNILKAMEDHAHPFKTDLRNVAGACFREGNEIKDNGMAPNLQDLDTIPSPFSPVLVDTEKPLVYYESSRGCPFTCAFCLSSLDAQVRSFSMERIRRDLLTLINSGVRQFKFVDRTFNYNAERSNDIWEFILKHNKASSFHFEIAADLLADENIEILKGVPKGVIRFEIGVQSLAGETLTSVGRKSNIPKLFSRVKQLVEETNVHVHLDLVAGLPGEDLSGFLESLQRLFLARPHHIQVEPLKVLKGAPMREIAKKEGYRFSSRPPYRIITTPWLKAWEIDLIDTMGRILELVHNSGRFKNSLPAIGEHIPLSVFFDGLARYWQSAGITTLSLDALFETLLKFAQTALEADHFSQFTDALCCDRLLANYPLTKSLSPYIARELNSCKVTRVEIKRIRKSLDIPQNTKVNALRYSFERDYGFGKGEHLFIYLSTTGKKQMVLVEQPKEILGA